MPAFSDLCEVTLIEGEGVPYRISRPGPTSQLRRAEGYIASAARLDPHPDSCRAITIAIPATEQSGLRGSVIFGWNTGYRPTRGDADIARAAVDRAHCVVRLERLSELVSAQRTRIENLETAVVTNRKIGAGARR